MFSELRGSGAIKQDAEVVLLIHCDEYYNSEIMNKGEVRIIVGKVRQGESDMCPTLVGLALNDHCCYAKYVG